MSRPLNIRHLFFLAPFIALYGCADFNAQPLDSTHPTQPDNTKSSVDKLLDFGASMSAMPEASRTDLCKSLLTTQQLLYSDDIQLQLMMGRLLSDACGDIPKILDGIHAMQSGYENDERLQKLIAIHTQALQQIHNQSKKPIPLKQKSKKLKSIPESKEAPETPNETHLLREKLEAIRSMEKQLDESLEGN